MNQSLQRAEKVSHVPHGVWGSAVLFIAIGAAIILRGQPAPPGPPLAATGTIIIEVNGRPIASGGVINIKSSTGVIASASPDPAINGTDITFTPDTAYLLGRDMDQANTDHALYAISTGCQGCVPGLKYAANGSPPLAGYVNGQVFALVLDVPMQIGATVNIDQLGPIMIQGTCVQACFVIASGTVTQPAGPVAAFLVR